MRDVIIRGCELDKMSQQDLADEIGLKSRSSVAVSLSRNNGMGMRVETLIKWLDGVGAELIVQFTDHNIEYLLDGEVGGVEYERNVRREMVEYGDPDW